MLFNRQYIATLLLIPAVLLTACEDASPPPVLESDYRPTAVNAVTIDYTGDVQIGEPWVMSQVEPIKQNICLESYAYSISSIDSSYHGQKVTSISDVQEILGVGVAASARGLVGHATAKVDFSRQVSTSRTNSTFIGRAHAEKTRTIKVEGESLLQQAELKPAGIGEFEVGKTRYPYAGILSSLPREIRLTEKAKKKLAESREAFVDYCGDGYIYSIFEGVEVYGYFSVNQVSGSVATAAEAMITGGTENYEAAVKAYYSTKREHASSKDTFDFKQYGGGSTGINPTNVEEFFKAARRVRPEVGAQGKPIRVTVASYETIPECRQSSNCPSFDTDEHNVVVLSYQLNALGSTLKQIDDVIANKDTVYASGRTQVNLIELRNQVSQSIESLKSNIRNCLVSNTACNLQGSSVVEPVLTHQLKLPLAYAAYPRQREYELSVAQYKDEVVRRAVKEAKHQLCEYYFSADSKYCGEVYNLDPQRLVALVSPVNDIHTGNTGNQDKGNPYQNSRQKQCLDISREKDKPGTAIILYDCKKGKKSSRKNQIFGYINGQLTSWDNHCIGTHKGSLRLEKCRRGAPNQTWLYTKSRQLRQNGYCLSHSRVLTTCSHSNDLTWLRKSH